MIPQDPRLPPPSDTELGKDTAGYVRRFIDRFNALWRDLATELSLITYGYYTPTLSNTTNVAASTAFACQWMRIGSVVTVSGKAVIDPTAAAPTATLIGISLPLPSDLAAEEQCAGVGNAYTVQSQGGAIVADTTNNRASYRFVAISDASQSHGFTFTYRII